MGRIALVNVPFVSHVGSMLRLAGVLARQGHELIVWAPEEWRDRVEALGARLEQSSPRMPRPPAGRLAAEFAALTEREAERLIPQLHAHEVELVIRDTQTPWALVAAQYLGIPQVASHPMFPMLGVDLPSGGQPDPEERERFERSWLSIARRWGVALADVRGLYHTMSAPTLLFTTEEIIGEERQLPPAWRCIGPLLPPAPPRRSGRSTPLVYVSFGTAQNRRTGLFRTVIAAMAGEPVELLISTGGRELSGELGPLGHNVTVTEFASTREALASASVHITHGGSNSVHESLMAGVPMVCLPQAFDQIPLSRRVEQLGVGMIAAEDSGSVTNAVLALLADVHARERASLMSGQLRRYDGESRVAAAIDAWM